ncbi:MAG: hypothetical protein ACO29Z_03005 [Crocinitomicaceae bacterium]
MSKQIFSLFFSLGSLFCVFAQDFNPKYANEYLNLGVGADALGMGSAVVAQNSGVLAGVWNPAGLHHQQAPTEIAGMHAAYFGGIVSQDHLGVSRRITASTVVALNMLRLGVDNIYNTTQLIDNNGNIDYSQLQQFNAADYAFIGSLSRPTRISNLAMGFNAKILYRHIGDFAKAVGFGLDAGLQYNPKQNLAFGLMLRDATSTFSVWTYDLTPEMQATLLETNNALPQNGIEQMLPRLIVGASGFLPIPAKKLQIGGEVDFEITADGPRNTLVSGSVFSMDQKTGLYVKYDKKLSFRTGVSQWQYYTNLDLQKKLTVQPHMGVGLQLKQWQIDYAFTRLGLGNSAYFSHLFSFKWALGLVPK